MKPREAITKQCIECVGGAKYVEGCMGDTCKPPCLFFSLRLGKGRAGMKLIRELCKDCMCSNTNAIEFCPSEQCNLYEFRLGRRI